MMKPVPVIAFRFERAGDPEVHDLGISLAVDHDVAGLEVAMDDAQPVGLGQPVADLPGDGNRRSEGKLLDLLIRLFRSSPATYSMVMKDVPGFAQVVHAADIAVRDHAGDLEFLAESVDRLPVRGNIGLDELQGDFLADLFVFDPIDLADGERPQLVTDSHET